jgi:hypothetical protein
MGDSPPYSMDYLILRSWKALPVILGRGPNPVLAW